MAVGNGYNHLDKSEVSRGKTKLETAQKASRVISAPWPVAKRAETAADRQAHEMSLQVEEFIDTRLPRAGITGTEGWPYIRMWVSS